MQRIVKDIKISDPATTESTSLPQENSYLQPIFDAFPARQMHILETGPPKRPRLYISFCFSFYQTGNIYHMPVHVTASDNHDAKFPDRS